MTISAADAEGPQRFAQPPLVGGQSPQLRRRSGCSIAPSGACSSVEPFGIVLALAGKTRMIKANKAKGVGCQVLTQQNILANLLNSDNNLGKSRYKITDPIQVPVKVNEKQLGQQNQMKQLHNRQGNPRQEILGRSRVT